MTRVGWLAGAVALVAAPWLVDGYATTLLTRALSFGLLAVSVALLAGVILSAWSSGRSPVARYVPDHGEENDRAADQRRKAGVL